MECELTQAVPVGSLARGGQVLRAAARPGQRPREPSALRQTMQKSARLPSGVAWPCLPRHAEGCTGKRKSVVADVLVDERPSCERPAETLAMGRTRAEGPVGAHIHLYGRAAERSSAAPTFQIRPFCYADEPLRADPAGIVPAVPQLADPPAAVRGELAVRNDRPNRTSSR